jgi:hypothetical protein
MNARRWSFATLVGVVSAAVYAMVPSRGVNLWGLQLIETIDAHRMARAGGDLAAAFAHPSGVFPGVPAVLRLGGEPLTTATLACAVAAGLGVALVFVWASRIAGPIAGGFAALALALSPRWVAAATAPSMTVFAVVAVLGFAVALCAAVRNPRATPWVWVAAIACAQTSLVGWLAFLPGLWVTVAPPQHGVRLGLLTARPVQLGALVAPLVGIGSLLLFAWFWEDTGTRIGNLLEVWMKRPSEAALVAGERIGPVRINAWSPGVLWWQTLPSWVSVCAVGGWVSLRRSSASSHTMAEREAALESTRMVRVYLAAAWLAVVGFGTLHFAGLDLLAFGLPVLAVLAGVFIARALRALPGQTVKVAVALSAAVAVSASGVAEMSRYGGALEAYTPGSRGGVHQAMRDGRASITHPVISPAWAREAQQLANGGTLAILTNAWEARPVLDAYARWGLVDEAWRWAEPRDADVVIVFDDATLPERYAYATDIAGIRADDGPRAEHRVDGVVLYGAYRLTDER